MAGAKPEHNERSFAKMAMVAVLMFGFGYLLVPIYDVFCEITGLNGKTGQIAAADAERKYDVDTSRLITVQFVANKGANLTWDFEPAVTSMQVHPGQIYGANFVATNSTGSDTVGQAVPSVAPGLASRYFNKTECFCFDNQPLKAGEQKDMPLRFIVSPSLPKKIETVTLAYTMYDVTEKAQL